MKGLLARIAARSVGEARRRAARIAPASPPAWSSDALVPPPRPGAPFPAMSDRPRAEPAMSPDASVPNGAQHTQAAAASRGDGTDLHATAPPVVAPAMGARSAPIARAQAFVPPRAPELDSVPAQRPAASDAESDGGRERLPSRGAPQARRSERPEASAEAAVALPPLVTPATVIARREASNGPPRRAQSHPAVNVTIGVVEVRAHAASPSPPSRARPRASRQSAPALSVDAYLADREAGRR
jgi:hypothetical protein